MRTLPTRVAEIVVAALLAAHLALLMNVPWLPREALRVAWLVSAPLTFAVAIVTVLLVGSGRRLGVRLPRAETTVGLAAAGLVAFAGIWAANRFLVQGPGGRHTLAAGAAALGAAIGVFVVLRRQLRRTGVAAQIGPLRGAACATLAIGIAGALTDSRVMPGTYATYHVATFALAVTAFALTALLLVASDGVGRWLWLTCTGLLIIAVLGQPAPRGAHALLALGRSTSHTALLRAAWWISDRDGDGYSAWLGGGDCDDAAPTAYPLSLERDCLGWRSRSASSLVNVAAPASPAETSGPRPSVIVMVTVDALRCDLPDGLGDGCPSLRRLGAAGRMRTDAHSPGAVTVLSFEVMHRARYWMGPQRPDAELALLPTFKRAGWTTHAIATHPHVLPHVQIRAAFTEVDESLSPLAADPSASTAQLVSERVLARVRRAFEPEGGPLFVLAHQFDPHAPYIDRPGAVAVGSWSRAYAAEVRRTDAAVGWLADQLARLPRANEILLLVTADHGEEFGEHGGTRHGFTVYDESTRIPFVAWTPGAEPRRFLRGGLPGSLVEVAAFVRATLDGVPFVGDSEFLVRGMAPLDPQVALVSPDWKLIHHLVTGHQELYDRRLDPLERHNRASELPEQVNRLGRRLAARLAAER